MPDAPAAQLQMRFDSRSTSPAAALASWRDSLSRSWEMAIDPRHADAFHADVALWKLEDVIIGSTTFGPVQTRMRNERNIRADQLDLYRIILLREGEFHCDADGRHVSLAPQRFVITDMALPEANASSCTSTVMYVPRELLDEALPAPVGLHGVSPANACASLLADHLAALVNGAPTLDASELSAVNRATINLLAASLAMSADNVEAARPAVDSVMLRRARKFIEQRLEQEELSSLQVCAHLGVSRTTLYRLFEGLGGVANYIRERRLARIHQLLCTSQEKLSIARLAEGHGFKSATQFSRAFRAQFGYSASEAPGQVRAPSEAAGPTAQTARFDHWLSTLYG